MNLETTSETKHEELIKILQPLVDFMNENEYSYFIVAGKDGLCSRYMNGNYFDVHGMIKGMAETNKQVGAIVMEVVEELNLEKITKQS